MKREFNEKLTNVGDTIEFTRTYETQPVQAVIVGMTYWAHCLGASEIRVFCLDGSERNLCCLPMFAGAFKTVAKVASEAEGAAKVETARQAYKAHLSKYAVWSERFANGDDVSF